ncbi:myb-like protein X [Oppia nitens]|uniref:myb-like protein X n=1 Tax=Oppia nitens TaxID=1686743 RepID=UPI0023D9F1AA|nr:myb-like protein X [Oppia nitens]
MFSLTLFCLFIYRVCCNGGNGITDINVLDNYFDGATNYMRDQPIFDGVTLILPKRTPYGLTPVSHMETPAYHPVFHSRILPNDSQKTKKSSKRKFRHHSDDRRHHIKHRHKHKRKKLKDNYPKSIKDQLKMQYDSEPEDDEPNEDDEEDYIKNERTPQKSLSLFDSLPPHSMGNPSDVLNPFVQSDKVDIPSKYFPDKTFNKILTKNKKYRTATANQLSHKPQTRRPDSMPSLMNDKQNNSKNEEYRHKMIPSNSKNNNNFDKYNESHESDDERDVSDDNDDNDENDDNKHQLLQDSEDDKPDDSETDNEKNYNGIQGEDLKSNDDPNHYPHQYAIEIRWKNMENAPDGDHGDREMHSSKDLEDANYRHYKHEEEEHWHQKKWLDEGLRKAYMNGQPIHVHTIHKPKLKIPHNDDNYDHFPLYAQPLPAGATLAQINQHFAVPTPNFRVNNRFIQWAKNPIAFNAPQLTVLG